MSDYLESDFLSEDQGYAYLIAKLTAFYGNRFLTNFQGIDPRMMKSTWVDILGKHLTYKPKIDYAIMHLDAEGYIANPNKILELCKDVRIPPKPETVLEDYRYRNDPAKEKFKSEFIGPEFDAGAYNLQKMKQFLGNFGK